MLIRYEEHFSEKPGKRNLMQYKFEVDSQELLTGQSRTLPFAVRSQVRKQTEELLYDGIIGHPGIRLEGLKNPRKPQSG